MCKPIRLYTHLHYHSKRLDEVFITVLLRSLNLIILLLRHKTRSMMKNYHERCKCDGMQAAN